jgi:hypothetical protein
MKGPHTLMSLIQHLYRGRLSVGLTLVVLVTTATMNALAPLPSATPAHAQVDVGCRRTELAKRMCRQASTEFEKAGALSSDASDVPPATLHELFHADGQKVGEIYVARAPGASTYVEHWVMFDSFEYPDVIRPAEDQPYTSEQDFLARVPFGPGYRYARWDVAEQSRIPGR